MKKSRLLGAVCTCEFLFPVSYSNAALITFNFRDAPLNRRQAWLCGWPVFLAILLLSVVSNSNAALVNYSYEGLTFESVNPDETDIANNPSLANPFLGSHISGYFIVEELAPSTITNFAVVGLPSFSFSDGARTISNANIVAGPGDIQDSTDFYIQAFDVTTNADGDILAWAFRFVNNSFNFMDVVLSSGSGSGFDTTRVTTGQYGCVSGLSTGSLCQGQVLYTNENVQSWSTSAVPIPTAVWLFGSGLLGLIGISRRKKSA